MIIFGVLCAGLLSACGPIAASDAGTAGDSRSPSGAPTIALTSAKADLAGLATAESRQMKGYSRDRFPHWNNQGGGCDTRDLVLKRDGKDVKVTDRCKITSGSWLSPYDDQRVTDPGQLDIDHMVPLANAWRSGADSWDDTKRSAFANDLTRPQLLAVSATTNRSKGDQDPSQWRPRNTAYWCMYAKQWITVKHYWKLTVTAAEKAKLSEMLGTCA